MWLTPKEQRLKDAAEELIKTIDNVSDTRREHTLGLTETETLDAVEDGFTSTLVDVFTMIRRVRDARSRTHGEQPTP